jgi:NAD(P)-dependent dehydrogenase (short-subunit alcohol dehydrogenase family)
VIKPTYGANVDCGNGKTLARELAPEGIITNVVAPARNRRPRAQVPYLEQIKTRYAAETP